MDFSTVGLWLLGLTIPLGSVAIAAGAVSAVRAHSAVRKRQRLRRNAVTERVALFACAMGGAAALTLLIRGVPEIHWMLVAVALTLLALCATGIASYFNPARHLVEPMAAIALGAFSIVTGFSVGALIAPFAVAMGVLANMHSRVERRLEGRETRRGSS